MTTYVAEKVKFALESIENVARKAENVVLIFSPFPTRFSRGISSMLLKISIA